MSVWDTLAWARRVRTGSPGRKATLMVLAEHADERNSCFPSQRLLAEATEQSERTVRAQLADLENAGLIRREHRGREGGGRTSDRYYLLVNPANLAANDTGEHEDDTGARAPERTGALLPPNTQMNLHPEPPTTPRAGELLADTFEAFWQAYPRKTAKGDARKAWPAAVKAAGGAGPIIAGAGRYAADPNRDASYTAHASTWLRAERWADPPLPPRGQTRGPRPNPANVRGVDDDRSGPTGRLDLDL